MRTAKSRRRHGCRTLPRATRAARTSLTRHAGEVFYAAADTTHARRKVSTRADRPDVLIMGGSFYYNCHYATSDLDLNPRALHHIAASRTLAVITSSRSLAVSVKGLARSLALSSRPRSHTHAVIIGVHRRCGDVGQHLGPRSLARAVISSSAPRSHAHAVITSSRSLSPHLPGEDRHMWQRHIHGAVPLTVSAGYT